MNGLKFIRTQCNLSLNHVARALDVSRQIVSVWESGKKVIPDERKEQLSNYFGINARYFDEIDEIQKNEILGTAMYRWNHGGDDFFLFRPDEESERVLKGLCTFEQEERKILLSDELKAKKQSQKEIIERMNQQIEGEPRYNLNDQITSINRGVRYYDRCAESYKIIYDQPSSHKMSYYYRALEVVDALVQAFGGKAAERDDEAAKYFEADDYTYQIDPEFVQKCANMIKEHMKPILKNLDEIDERRRKRQEKKL